MEKFIISFGGTILFWYLMALIFSSIEEKIYGNMEYTLVIATVVSTVFFFVIFRTLGANKINTRNNLNKTQSPNEIQHNKNTKLTKINNLKHFFIFIIVILLSYFILVVSSFGMGIDIRSLPIALIPIFFYLIVLKPKDGKILPYLFMLLLAVTILVILSY